MLQMGKTVHMYVCSGGLGFESFDRSYMAHAEVERTMTVGRRFCSQVDGDVSDPGRSCEENFPG